MCFLYELIEWLHNNVSEKILIAMEENLKKPIDYADLYKLLTSMCILALNEYRFKIPIGLFHKTREVRNNWSHLSPNKFPSPKNIINDLQTMKKFMFQFGGEKATDTIIDIDRWIKELSAGN